MHILHGGISSSKLLKSGYLLDSYQKLVVVVLLFLLFYLSFISKESRE